MGNKMGVVNVFAQPYEVWSHRDTTPEEALSLVEEKGLRPIEAMRVKDELLDVVSTHSQAAAYMIRVRADNGLEGHVDRALDVSPEYRELLGRMPCEEVKALRSYQGEFPRHDAARADMAIQDVGVELPEGQILFHGGRWPSDGSTFTTSRPLSTSFCPQVALRNSEWRGKAYDAGQVDLLVLRVTQSQTKAYAYRRDGQHGNEKEVVFASGARLTRVSETYVADITVSRIKENFEHESKRVPAYVIEVEIS